MSLENVEKRIIDELGIDGEVLSLYSEDIKKISLEIGDNNVLAENDNVYNKDLSYKIIKTIVGKIDTYYIVKFN